MKKRISLLLGVLIVLSTTIACSKAPTPSETEAFGTNPSETEVFETETPETEVPETTAPEATPLETGAQILRPEGFDLSSAFRTDTFKARNSLKKYTHICWSLRLITQEQDNFFWKRI